jgi:hypothetical protein
MQTLLAKTSAHAERNQPTPFQAANGCWITSVARDFSRSKQRKNDHRTGKMKPFSHPSCVRAISTKSIVINRLQPNRQPHFAPTVFHFHMTANRRSYTLKMSHFSHHHTVAALRDNSLFFSNLRAFFAALRYRRCDTNHLWFCKPKLAFFPTKHRNTGARRGDGPRNRARRARHVALHYSRARAIRRA